MPDRKPAAKQPAATPSEPPSIALLDQVFEIGEVADLKAAYEHWAETYDSDNLAQGFRLPVQAAAFVARYVAADAMGGGGPILDAGAGTGLLGEALAVLGYRDLVGIDLSPGMLARAADRGCYVKLAEMVLGEPLDFPDGHFRAVVASGVFNQAHGPAAAFDELVRITRPGGHLIFSVRDDTAESEGFLAKFAALEAAGRWRLIERSPSFAPYYEAQELVSRILVYETCI